MAWKCSCGAENANEAKYCGTCGKHPWKPSAKRVQKIFSSENLRNFKPSVEVSSAYKFKIEEYLVLVRGDNASEFEGWNIVVYAVSPNQRTPHHKILQARISQVSGILALVKQSPNFCSKNVPENDENTKLYPPDPTLKRGTSRNPQQRRTFLTSPVFTNFHSTVNVIPQVRPFFPVVQLKYLWHIWQVYRRISTYNKCQ
ncbi:hypothetical protein K440DRAFT_638296 [Wilcoxina mikolae CBS 423.85]|nr:hypothetical protein K440DRAFT_638296 [Wilcoxina mikolae CBS 423.85]